MVMRCGICDLLDNEGVYMISSKTNEKIWVCIRCSKQMMKNIIRGMNKDKEDLK